MSEMGQTEKYSARGDLFRSSPKNGHWTPYFGEPSIELRRSIVMEYASPIGRHDRVKRGFESHPLPLVRYNLLFFKENLVQNYPLNGPQAVKFH